MTQASQLAFGRILRMAARPEQPGDVAEYERCRKIILDEAEAAGIDISRPPGLGTFRPGWNAGNMVLD